MTVRLRIAPSPTGSLHVGNARSAVFNWLYARRHGGQFIVRVDDTDTARSDERHVSEMIDGLRWLGLDWDEGIEVGGPHGTYRQSDRFDRYREAAEQLWRGGDAYYCFCTPEELDVRRAEAQKAGRPPGYDGLCRAIDTEQARARVADDERASLRLAVPRPGVTEFRDLVRDDMRFDHENIDDFVLLRSSGAPTYHLASTVDDVDYDITHVARGEDLLSSTPKHILITEALGASSPTYAHLPLLFGPDGKKLSKRHGDTSLKAFISAGYLPEAMFNYMSLLGWSYDPEITIYSADEAIARFDLDDVSKNPAVFDVDKLQWMNGEYIRAMPVSEFIERSRPALEEGLGSPLEPAEFDKYRQLAPLIQERIKMWPETAEMVRWLYVDEVEYDQQSWSKVMEKEPSAAVLSDALGRLEKVDPWTTETIEAAMRAMLEELDIGARKGFQPLRVAVTGSSISPPLFESMEVLGKQASLGRIGAASARLAAG